MSERAEKRAHAAEENGEDVAVAAKQSKGENGKDKTAEEKIETVKGLYSHIYYSLSS
jgi:hypothetical protein